jgi:hypothetical protein
MEIFFAAMGAGHRVEVYVPVSAKQKAVTAESVTASLL